MLQAFAQKELTKNVKPERNIHVLGYFALNDTMYYTCDETEMYRAGSDTILYKSEHQDFRIVVLDSTSQGYRMEYSLINFTIDGTQSEEMLSIIDQAMHFDMHQPCIFSTSPEGELLHIDNWEEIRDNASRFIPSLIDSMFLTVSGLDTLVNRDEIIELMLDRVSTEEKICESYKPVSQLFSYFGYSFKQGNTERETVNDFGFISKVRTNAGYNSPQSSSDYTGDYSINSYTDGLLSDKADVDAIEALLEAIVPEDVLAEAEESQKKDELVEQLTSTLKVNSYENYRYFFNGWPKRAMQIVSISAGPYEKSSTIVVGLKSKNWN